MPSQSGASSTFSSPTGLLMELSNRNTTAERETSNFMFDIRAGNLQRSAVSYF